MKDLEKAAASVLLGEKKHLTAKQQQIDVHEPEKDELTAKDFEMLRANKKAKPMKEEQVQEVAPMVAAVGRALATTPTGRSMLAKAAAPTINKMTSTLKSNDESVKEELELSEDQVKLIEFVVEYILTEGWEDMMKAVKERSKPQPSGGAGIKLGTRYGGGKQKEKEKEEKEPVKEDIDYSFGDYLKVAKEKFGEEEAVKIANDAFNKKDISIFSNDSEA